MQLQIVTVTIASYSYSLSYKSIAITVKFGGIVVTGKSQLQRQH